MPKADNKVSTTYAEDNEEANTSDTKTSTMKSHMIADDNDEVNIDGDYNRLQMPQGSFTSHAKKDNNISCNY